MTFEEQAAELHCLEAAAKALGMTEGAFERIAAAVNREGLAEGWTPEKQLAEIRRRVYVVGDMRDRNPNA